MPEKDQSSWDGTERREINLRDLEDHIDRRISARLEAHAAQERRDKDSLMSEIKQVQHMLMRAFPDGDVEGHRRFHEESLETMRDLRDLLRKVRNNTVTGLVWAVIVLVGVSTLQYITNYFGGGSQ